MMNLFRPIILWSWPISGVLLIGWAIWRLCRRRWVSGGISLCAGLLLAGSFAALVWFTVNMFKPAHGKPDSEKSRQGFEQAFRQQPAPGIMNLRYWGHGFTDHTILIRFDFASQEDIVPLITHLKLEEDSKAEHELRSTSFPEWWKRAASTTYKIYSSKYGSGWIYLWIDEAKRIVFYQDYST